MQIKKSIEFTNKEIERLFMDWAFIRNNLDMDRLKQTSGSRTAKGAKSKRKTDINDLDQNDRAVYQRIVEDIMEKHKIPKSEITKRIQEEKINNIKGLAETFGINRTNIYYKSKVSIKVFSYNLKLIKEIKGLIKVSEGSIGRGKAYMILDNRFNITTYVFGRHWKSLGYISSYRGKYRKATAEKKYKEI